MKFDFNYSVKTKPLSHQIEAIDYIENRKMVSIFDEQGLGKTKMAIEALCNNFQQGVLDGALIICKKGLIKNWADEIYKHSYLKCVILRGSPNEKGIKFMSFAHFYIINYESVIGEIERLKMFLSIRRMAIVLDESHRIKNPNAKTTNAIFNLKDKAYKRIIITGSPLANKPNDLWAQYYFLDDGLILGNNYKDFERRYTIDLKDTDPATQQEVFSNLRRLVIDNSLRRLKEDVLELPDKIFYDKYVVLEGVQESMYNLLRDEMVLELTNLQGDIIIDRSDMILKKLLRLAQIASNPLIIDKAYNGTPSKFKILDSILNMILEKGEKTIIWSSFIENIRVLYNRYKTKGSLMLYGDLTIDKRNENVKKFMNDENFRILVANPSVAKEGLTLTSANNAIYLDRNFNLVDYLQSQDRIHRISQTRECSIFKIIAKNTIDEYIDEIIKKKTKLASFIQGDSTEIESGQYLTRDELFTILGGTHDQQT